MDRWVDFAGLFNFRDVGALTGRPGVIYRSDALCSLVDEDRPRYEALSLVGVPDEEIGADYTLTEQFTQRWLKWRLDTTGETVELPPNILHTPAGAILLYLARLRERHGTVQEYLRLDTSVVSALRSMVVA